MAVPHVLTKMYESQWSHFRGTPLPKMIQNYPTKPLMRKAQPEQLTILSTIGVTATSLSYKKPCLLSRRCCQFVILGSCLVISSYLCILLLLQLLLASGVPEGTERKRSRVPTPIFSCRDVMKISKLFTSQILRTRINRRCLSVQHNIYGKNTIKLPNYCNVVLSYTVSKCTAEKNSWF